MYIPLGGSQEGKWRSIRNIFIIFIVSGFWHGANWTFVFWGIFHSILFIPLFLFNSNRKYIKSIIGENKIFPNPKELLQVSATFILVTIGWVFFRSDTIGDSFNFLYSMFFKLGFPSFVSPKIFLYLLILIVVDWTQRIDERNLFYNFPNLVLRIFVVICVFLILINFKKESQQFIYFDF